MFECYLPKSVFGNGEIKNVGKHVKQYGSKAFLVIDPFLEQSDAGSGLIKLLKQDSLLCAVFSDFGPNPSCFKVDEAAKAARDKQADVVLACGGGSAIDVGKGVALTVTNPGTCWEYTERSDHDVKRPSAPRLPIITIPTTAGTGTEATPFAVFNNPDLKEKSTIVNHVLFPDFSIIDPDLMVTMPPRLTAATGFDAFAHALEAFISIHATPFSDLAAKEAMRLIYRYLPQAVQNGENRIAREKLAWASTLAGVAIGHIGVTLPHALGQPVSGLCGMPHGESVAACTVNILEKSYLADEERFAAVTALLADLAGTLGNSATVATSSPGNFVAGTPATGSLTVRERAELCPRIVEKLLNDIDLSVRFSDYGMTEADIEKVTKIAVTGYYFDINCHPRKVTEEEIKQIYRECL